MLLPHAAFEDFSKAFDSVNHEALWEVLETRGIHPKLIIIIIKGHSLRRACLQPAG